MFHFLIRNHSYKFSEEEKGMYTYLRNWETVEFSTHCDSNSVVWILDLAVKQSVLIASAISMLNKRLHGMT